MPRALWKGSIAFGLVNIPVELHTAVRDTRPRFRMLHAEDRSPVRFERICQREGKPVAWVVTSAQDARNPELQHAGATGSRKKMPKKTTARASRKPAA